MKSLLSLFLISSAFFFGHGQQSYQVRTIAFYNVENLFDTVNDTLVFDDDRSPKGAFQWTRERYDDKISNIAHVLSQIGLETTKTSPDLIGVCEVENRQVLLDLVNHKKLVAKDYGVIHFDSPDNRGIDVALLYKKSVFLPTASKSHRLLLFDDDGERKYTRDQLVVSGYLDEEELHLIVNHWPSRRGGQSRSEPFRLEAAKVTKRIIDSLQRLDLEAKIITMGDFNDDPRDASLKKVLRTKAKPRQLDSVSLFNPMERLHKKGYGTLAYRDKWNLFDQFVLTPSLVDSQKATYSFWRAGIFAPDSLKVQSGKYKGYPYRTYVGTTYQGGYADHFPVYLYLIRREGK